MISIAGGFFEILYYLLVTFLKNCFQILLLTYLNELKTSQEKCEHLEAQSTRENLRLYGVDEMQNETWEDTEKLVREYISKDLDMDDTDISIERAHRIPSREKPRPIIVKFSFYKDRDRILKTYRQKRKNLRQSEPGAQQGIESGENENADVTNDHNEFRRDIHISEDFPSRVMKVRNDLRPFLKKALSEGKDAHLKYDKLIINRDAYTYDNETEGLSLVEK
ncbi:MAG: hypothetical protein AB2693_15565 [Candidatus Thiodiazotropha sp.]